MNIFEELNDLSKELGFDFEHAVQVNKHERIVTGGIFVNHSEARQPLFLSVDELRRMADKAEKLTIQMVAKEIL